MAQGLCAPQAELWVGAVPFFPLDLTWGLKQFADDFIFITSLVLPAATTIAAIAVEVPAEQLRVTTAASSSYYFFVSIAVPIFTAFFLLKIAVHLDCSSNAPKILFNNYKLLIES